MLKLFKKSQPENPSKAINKVIEEIHETFYSEVDRLLASAKIANSLDTDKQALIEKSDRLKALGFNNTKEVKEAEAEIRRLNKLKRENEVKKTLIEAINYFSIKYPNYKFITQQSVERICEKYNLVYGEIGKYIGTVPDKNLKHIEDFKVLEDDECCISYDIHDDGYKLHLWNQEYQSAAQRRIELERKALRDKEMFSITAMQLHPQRGRYIRHLDMKCPLEIAAPAKDFDLRNSEIKNHHIEKIEIPDPIVLKPVIFQGEKYYLIVTSWGLEAGDELVVNANHN